MAEPALASPPSPRLPPVDRDDRVVLRGVTWADYERLLEIRGENPVPRLLYLDGVLELMSPSRSHDVTASMIGCLVEAWCFETGLDVTPYDTGRTKAPPESAAPKPTSAMSWATSRSRSTPISRSK